MDTYIALHQCTSYMASCGLSTFGLTRHGHPARDVIMHGLSIECRLAELRLPGVYYLRKSIWNKMLQNCQLTYWFRKKIAQMNLSRLQLQTTNYSVTVDDKHMGHVNQVGRLSKTLLNLLEIHEIGSVDTFESTQ